MPLKRRVVSMAPLVRVGVVVSAPASTAGNRIRRGNFPLELDGTSHGHHMMTASSERGLSIPWCQITSSFLGSQGILDVLQEGAGLGGRVHSSLGNGIDLDLCLECLGLERWWAT